MHSFFLTGHLAVTQSREAAMAGKRAQLLDWAQKACLRGGVPEEAELPSCG